ncbi:nucleotide exchange factor GrpE [Lujinxingia litoralis]|uniref:Protein GrpE n=1 Tax=Lujinxingia litoralis TaxID=2211119 RepID=A0A328C998_9DELT|nr:nucleotide exchange factor GrpE [Lujinxingia litoralis]RAL25197.1 nucleotide exchange factor GrpE [Lujinxingia litoralis]
MTLVLLIMTTVIATIALALLGAYHRRELRRLRQAHRQEVRAADDEHTRRLQRLGREHDDALQYAHHPVVRDILPALDALDEGLRHSAPHQDPALRNGLELAHRALLQALERHGVERVAPGPGDGFDPQWHQAVARVETNQVASGSVNECLRAGYRDGPRQLRAAMVEVACEPHTFPQPPQDVASPDASPSPEEPSSAPAFRPADDSSDASS